MSDIYDFRKVRYCDVLRSVLRTEKTAGGAANDKVKKIYFEVEPSANKAMVKRAVESLFSVGVIAVNSMNRKGKSVKFRGVEGRRSAKKIMIVSLAAEQNISILDQ